MFRCSRGKIVERWAIHNMGEQFSRAAEEGLDLQRSCLFRTAASLKGNLRRANVLVKERKSRSEPMGDPR